jgi:hypothetical protein
MISFAECVRVTVAIDLHFITTCNKAVAETPADDDDVDADLVHDLARSNSQAGCRTCGGGSDVC